MKTRTLLAGVSALAIAIAAYVHFGGEGGVPPTMNKEGETVQDGVFVKKKTVDYAAIIKSALTEKVSFMTLTVASDMIRNRQLETSIKYTPLPSSTALVRVKYHVEYPIGYVLTPGSFLVRGGADGLTITLHRPRLIARPSVKLKSYQILESGILIDEKTALLDLQQDILPVEERRAARVLNRPDVIPRSEKALRTFLQAVLKREGEASPPITFIYR